MDDARRFWAFLSYSHRDRRWAAWLHRALETYAIPSRLIGRPSPAGRIPRRLAPIFKDREELAANAGLRAHVQSALEHSSALIVICSPAAAASEWVEEEIVRFKALRGENRVFAVIVAGTPGASRIAGRESEECFPSALRFHVDSTGALTDERAELIAADLRRGGDGRTLARLKLIAGILGLDLDDLARRDAHRRAQQMSVLAAGSLAVAVAMGGLALAALASRNEARAQRAQAEGLVRFMLGDLRKKLEPVSRLDVLDAVGAHALAYYVAQEKHGLDDEALGRRADVLQLLGEIQEKLGNLGPALREFSEASATTAELLARRSQDPQRIRDHAHSVYYVGEVAYARGQNDAALRQWLEYKRLTERLIAIEPRNVEQRSELADVDMNLGALLLKERQPAKALPAFRRALEIERDLVERSPKDQDRRTDLVDAYGWLANAEAMAGNNSAALDDRLAQRRICQQSLAENPDDHTTAETLMVNHRAVASIYSSGNRLAEAVAELILATRAAEGLIGTDRANTRYQSEAVLAYIDLGRALLRRRAIAPAQIAAKRADVLAEALARKDRTVAEWVGFQLGSARLLQIRIAATTANGLADCRRALAPAVPESARLSGLAADRQDDLRLARIAAEGMLLNGDYNFSIGRGEEARAAWSNARRLLTRALGAEGTPTVNDGTKTIAEELADREVIYRDNATRSSTHGDRKRLVGLRESYCQLRI